MDKNKAKNYKKLSPEQIVILENKGTEAPFTGALLQNKKSGEVYLRCLRSQAF